MTNTTYDIDFSRYYDHLAQVSLHFVADSDAPTLWLPTWIAGSYLIREFARHIGAVQYRTSDGDFSAVKTDKNHFSLPCAAQGQAVVVTYTVYCHDLSVRTAFVDNSRIFGNFTSLIMMITGQEYRPIQINLHLPASFIQNKDIAVASGLSYELKTHSTGMTVSLTPVVAFESYDYPFEIAEQTVFEFDITVQNKVLTHHFYLSGRQAANLTRLRSDVQRICQAYVDWLGSAPFESYTFMTMVTGSDYGGLEHSNSTALVIPRSDLPCVFEPNEPSDGYQRYLGLCSHEYFHAWWVKAVRPDVMMTSELQTEGYTPLLWVFEGFTTYIDDLMLLRSGVISQDSYLKLISTQINRYLQTDGRTQQSVAESSMDAWIKLYRPDENTVNHSVSYYNKGALVALCLDLSLMMHSNGAYRLFDVIHHCYEQSTQTDDKRFGLTTEYLGQVVSKMMGVTHWQSFYQRYVVGVDELPLLALFDQFAISYQLGTQTKAWGLSGDDAPAGLKITHLHRECMASQAGLSVGDIIVAIDGIKATKTLLEATARQQAHTKKNVSVHAFRRDELMNFTIKAGVDTTHNQIQLVSSDGAWLVF